MYDDRHQQHLCHDMGFRRGGGPSESGTDGEWVIALGLGLLALALEADAVSVLAVMGLALGICWAHRRPDAEPDRWLVVVRAATARRNRPDVQEGDP